MSAQDHSAAEEAASAPPVSEPNSTTRFLAFGAAVAAIVAVADQLSKLWVSSSSICPTKAPSW